MDANEAIPPNGPPDTSKYSEAEYCEPNGATSPT
jgi:hypothetical protein